jgi:SAM-dependent methyltransferase
VAGPPDPVVDVGTGAGSSLDVFPDAWRVKCLDASKPMLLRAARRRRIAAVAGDANRLPFRGGSVRLLSVVGLTEYIGDHAAFLEQAGSTLAAGGYLLITVASLNAFNILRNGLGHALHLVRPGQWEARMHGAGFVCLGKKASLLQVQYLYQKRERGD